MRQRGRASSGFLVDVRIRSNPLEADSDRFAQEHGLHANRLPEEPEQLQDVVTPVMHQSAAFRVLRLCRDWTLEQHGSIALEAFEEIRSEVVPQLDALGEGPTQLTLDPALKPPAYWEGYEFHRSEGGWDGHDYMGFVHGELIHRKMVGEHYAGLIFQQRKSTAKIAPVDKPARILEMGCSSGHYTMGLIEAYPDSEIWACDLSQRQLEQLQRAANERGVALKLFQAAAEQTGLEAQQFDLVTSYAMFHELPSEAARRVLRESLRLLKPGACLLVGDVKAYHAQDNYERWKADYWNQMHGGDPFWREYASADLAQLALDEGFVEASWSGVEPDQYPFVLLARKAA
ncbi:MAG: class I SAM-dependent methyltransferase [Gammaproteobacteria bacterium]